MPTRSRYGNYVMKQVPDTMGAFNNFFDKEKFKAIIEIGTCPGGFAIYLAEKANEMGADFYTFDISQPANKVKDVISKNSGMFFSEDANKTDKITEFLAKYDRVLLLNDGAKYDSFNKYGPLLKKYDYMFIHDYIHKAKAIFDGLATYKDFQRGLVKYNLQISDYTKIFRNYMWMCVERSK